MKKVGQWERQFRWGLILSFIGMVAGLIVSFVFVIVREVHPLWMIAGVVLGGLPGSVFSVIASIAAGKEVKSKKQRKQ
jgi:cytochrome c oxidase subunit IV